MKKAIIYVLAFLAIQLIIGGVIQTAWSALVKDADRTMMLIISSSAANIIGIILFLRLRWAEVSPTYIRTRPWSTFLWCAVAACGAVIPSVWFQEQMPELPNIVEEELGGMLQSRWGYIALGVLAPLGEELVFRGAVLRALLSWTNRHWGAIALSAFFFALFHANPAQMPHAFLIGLLLGWLYYRTHSIAPGVIYHLVNNSIAYVMYNLYPNPDTRLIDIFGTQRTVAAAVVFSLFIFLPALYQLNLRLRKAE